MLGSRAPQSPPTTPVRALMGELADVYMLSGGLDHVLGFGWAAADANIQVETPPRLGHRIRRAALSSSSRSSHSPAISLGTLLLALPSRTHSPLALPPHCRALTCLPADPLPFLLPGQVLLQEGGGGGTLGKAMVTTVRSQHLSLFVSSLLLHCLSLPFLVAVSLPFLVVASLPFLFSPLFLHCLSLLFHCLSTAFP